jgi:hypothetical protein
MTVKDAVLGWARAFGAYVKYGGRECATMLQAMWTAGHLGISWEDVGQAFTEGMDNPTPYLMGWVAQIMHNDPTADMDTVSPMDDLGRFDETPEYKQGCIDAADAARVIWKHLKPSKKHKRSKSKKQEEVE